MSFGIRASEGSDHLCSVQCEKKKGKKNEKARMNKKNKKTRMIDKEGSSYAPTVLKRTGDANEEGWVEDPVV